MKHLRSSILLIILGTCGAMTAASDDLPVIPLPTPSIMSSVNTGYDITRQVCHTTLTPAFYERQINPNDLDKNAAVALYTITDSGRYYIPQDISANPNNNNVSVIKITASNVALNLNARTLTHTGSSTNVTMIEIGANVSNVIIFNGTINKIEGTGIKINSGCSGIVLCSLQINGCSLTGISANSSNNIQMRETSITNGTGTNSNATDGALGLKLTSCSSVSCSHCDFNNNSNIGSKDGNGVILSGCTDCIFEHCSAAKNQGDNAYGFKIISQCASCQFVDCSAIANTSDNGDAVGFYIDSSDSIKCIACQSESQLSAVGQAAGYLFNNASCFVINKCDAQSNKASISGTTSFGYKITNSSGGYIACSKATCTTSTSSNAYGFYLSNTKHTTTEECVSQHNDASTGSGNAYGYYTTAGTGNIFEKCSAIGNQGGTAASSVGAGFAFRSGEKYSSILCCHAAANDGGANGTGYGIQFGSTGETITKCVVKNNHLIDNTGSALYGYKDFSNPTSTFLASNIAFGQGKIFTLGTETTTADDGANNYQFILGGGTDAKKIIIEIPISDFTNVNNGTVAHNISVY